MRDDMCGTTELCRGTDQPSSANNVTRYIGHFKPCKTDVSASTTASAAVMLHAAAGLPGAEQYAKGERCGFGTFGTVRRATCVADGSTVAIKKIRYACTDDNGISMAAIREVKILRHLSHENIVPLVNVFVHKDSIKLVFEYLKSDLQKVMDDASCTLGAADIKCYMLMLLRGLAHLHENEILHRDIKPNNLLISEGGILKIADFGRAKMSPSAFADDCAEREGDRFTSQVVMLQYRAPELLCGAQTYGPPIDVWACAVIMAELLTRKTFFRGERDVHMLCCIKEVLGAPGEGALADMVSQHGALLGFVCLFRVLSCVCVSLLECPCESAAGS
eukprot:SAG11_NODE_180_length_13278_cov_9.158434_2_plen_333_part_00